MRRLITALSRPLGAAFGGFIILNLALALQRPGLAVTSIWLEAALPEPWLSLFAGVLGLCLLVPHDLAKASWVRCVISGVIAGFAILTLVSTATFYHGLVLGEIRTDFPFPLSAFLCGILVLEFGRVFVWAPRPSRLPAPARAFLDGVCLLGAFLLLTLVHIVTFGYQDFRTEADAAVILGAKVHRSGEPSGALLDRLETGCDLYSRGIVHHLIMTGAKDPNGWNEPLVMRDHAIRSGVPAEDITVDESGFNTRASALSCRTISQERGFHRLLAVTQYFHCARVKMIFEREGVACATVPTCSSESVLMRQDASLSREGFFLLREVFAFPFYLIRHR